MRHYQLFACSTAFIFAGTLACATTYAADQANPQTQQPAGSETSPSMPGTAAAVSASSPKDACQQLVAAAQKDDFNTVQSLTTDWGHHGDRDRMSMRSGKSSTKMKQGFEKMRQNHMAELKSLSCDSEQIVGDHGFVTAKTSDNASDQRLIPFIKEGDSWKFDARTYMSFYRDSMKKMRQNTAQGSTAPSQSSG